MSLAEFAFEDVPTVELGNLIFEMVRREGNIIDYRYWSPELADEEVDIGQTCSQEKSDRWTSSLKEHTWLTVNIYNLELSTIKIPNCSIGFIRHNATQDVEVNFRLDEVEHLSTSLWVKELMAFSDRIAKQYGIQNFYCGLMPARDEDTRLFTNRTLGSLKF